jgi:predicted MFS family arabinose efflux permease
VKTTSDVGAKELQRTLKFGVDNAWTISSVVLGSGIALLALLLGPLLIGEYIRELGVTEARAGMILSMELSGFTLGSAILFVIQNKNWRIITASALVFMVAGNVLSLFLDSLSTFMLARFIAGLGAGMVMTMTIQVIALMQNTDRVYGMWTIGQLVLGALGMMIFPAVTAYGGIKAVFLIWALLAATLFATIRFYPPGRDSQSSPGSQHEAGRRLIVGLACLAGLFVYYSGQTGVWVYLERLGASWNIEPKTVGHILFISLLAGIAGSGVAILLANRIGRTIPIAASMIFSAASIVLLIRPGGALLFTLAAGLFNFGWYLFLPYISAVVAATDNNGRLLTGLAVTFPASLAVGPAFAAMLIGNTGSLVPALIFGLVSVPIGLVFILPAARFRWQD